MTWQHLIREIFKKLEHIGLCVPGWYPLRKLSCPFCLLRSSLSEDTVLFIALDLRYIFLDICCSNAFEHVAGVIYTYSLRIYVNFGFCIVCLHPILRAIWLRASSAFQQICTNTSCLYFCIFKIISEFLLETNLYKHKTKKMKSICI